MIGHEAIQAELSARLDGEAGTLGDDVVETHLEACHECRSFLERARALKSLTDYEAEISGNAGEDAEAARHAAVDRTDAILRQIETQWRRSTGGRQVWLVACRVGLVIAGIFFGYWAVATVGQTTGLLGTNGDETVLSPDAQPELAGLLGQAAAVRLATAIALFFGAWRPQILPGFLLFMCACTMFGLGFAMRDLIVGFSGAPTVTGLVLYGATTVVIGMAWWLSAGASRWGGWRALGAGPSQFG